MRISFPLPYDILDSDIKPSMCQIEPKLCSGGDGSGICSFCVKSTNLESPSLVYVMLLLSAIHPLNVVFFVGCICCSM